MKRQSRPKMKLVCLCVFLAASVCLGLGKAHAIKYMVSGLMDPTAPKREQVREMETEFRSLRMALRTLAYKNLSPRIYDASLAQVRGSIDKLESLAATYRQAAFAKGEELVFNNFMDSWTEFHAFGSRVIARHVRNSPADREAAMKMLVFDSSKYIRAFERDAALLASFRQ